MARVSNGIITILNLLTLFVSFAAIGVAVWFYVKAGSACESFLRIPLLIVGLALMTVSMAGLLGSCCRVSFFMWIYLITLFLLIMGLIIFTIFAVVVTNQGIRKELEPAGSQKLGDYSIWLQNYVTNGENWERIKSCLVHVKMCDGINLGGNGEESYRLKTSLAQSGCCNPPNNCGPQNSTVPERPGGLDLDCRIWRPDDPNELCYECESCKAAALDNISREWRILAVINACILISLTVIYSIGCCALRNNQSYGYTKYTNYYA